MITAIVLGCIIIGMILHIRHGYNNSPSGHTAGLGHGLLLIVEGAVCIVLAGIEIGIVGNLLITNGYGHIVVGFVGVVVVVVTLILAYAMYVRSTRRVTVAGDITNSTVIQGDINSNGKS